MCLEWSSLRSPGQWVLDFRIGTGQLEAVRQRIDRDGLRSQYFLQKFIATEPRGNGRNLVRKGRLPSPRITDERGRCFPHFLGKSAPLEMTPGAQGRHSRCDRRQAI